MFNSFFCSFLILAQVSIASPLPSKVDNSVRKEFPPIPRQIGNCCSHQAGVYFILGYNFNQQRGLSAIDTKNQYAAYHSWNYVNAGIDKGSEFGDGWAIAKYLGVPSIADYGVQNQSKTGVWMSGYDKYYRAMKNRVDHWTYVDVTTEDGFKKAKKWLVNRDGSTELGGLLATDFQLKDVKIATIKKGEPQAGKKIIKRWGRGGGGHLMTYVGYDDSVGYDFNNDGKITNDIDITGDNEVTMADWERGCFILANSWGNKWGNKGFIYSPYREHFVSGWERGKWVGIVKTKKNYQPRATIRLKMQCSSRRYLKIKWGLSKDVNAKSASEYTQCPLFRSAPLQAVKQPLSPEKFVQYSRNYYLIGKAPLRGPKNQEAIEMGFDLTEVLGSYEKAKQQKFFADFLIKNKKENGNVLAASLLFYSETGELVKTIPLITEKTAIAPTLEASAVIQ